MNTNTSYNHIAFLEAKATSLTSRYLHLNLHLYARYRIYLKPREKENE